MDITPQVSSFSQNRSEELNRGYRSRNLSPIGMVYCHPICDLHLCGRIFIGKMVAAHDKKIPTGWPMGSRDLKLCTCIPGSLRLPHAKFHLTLIMPFRIILKTKLVHVLCSRGSNECARSVKVRAETFVADREKERGRGGLAKLRGENELTFCSHSQS